MKHEFLMMHHAPKVMIYRFGKFNPQKGMSQELEFMLKFINNEEDQVWMRLIEFESPVNYDNPQEDDKKNGEIVHPDKIEQANRITCSVELP
jgi:hypothetical protein